LKDGPNNARSPSASRHSGQWVSVCMGRHSKRGMILPRFRRQVHYAAVSAIAVFNSNSMGLT
jgi:hypothetical protein